LTPDPRADERSIPNPQVAQLWGNLPFSGQLKKNKRKEKKKQGKEHKDGNLSTQKTPKRFFFSLSPGIQMNLIKGRAKGLLAAPCIAE